MSRELVVLSREQPDLDVLTELVAASGEADLKVGGRYVFDAQDRLLLRIRQPVLVAVPGEVERLLGIPANEPVWWVELQAAVTPAAERIAHHCAEGLAARHDGTVWSESGQ
ncbi:hypothetical protein [Actinomadura roseirufa]|uniref:hypothetical protein n=1 Tax=Actinomadura roseirufa TaxID=2094049 RepID=UPI001041607D|nr:hypothetical protein [Actinomadura roseirufa]